MQVEYKTEKGTVLFVKVPDDAKAWKNESYHVNTLWYKSEDMRNPKHIELPYDDLILIGIISDITEEQAKMMVGNLDGYGLFYKDVNGRSGHRFALSAFNSIMEHLQVYEVNPYSNECKCSVLEKQEVYDKCLSEIKNHNQAQSRTGKWVVLFKSYYF